MKKWTRSFFGKIRMLGSHPFVIIVVVIISFWVYDRLQQFDYDRLKVSSSLELVDRPADFAPSINEISTCHADGMEGIGSSKFLIFPEVDGRKYSLNAFDQACSISDLSWMMTRIYNQSISPKIVSGVDLTPFDLALIELALQVHLAYVHAAAAQFVVGVFGEKSDAKKMLESYYLHCYEDSEVWNDTAADTINTLCLRWYSSEVGEMARKVGGSFSGCNRDWLVWIMSELGKESSPDIRWNNLLRDNRGFWDRLLGDDPPQQVCFDFDNAYNMSLCWKEIHTSVYFESVSAVRRINREISIALSKVRDVDGYAGLHALIEKWRPRMKMRVLNYSMLYSDLPLTILSKSAYDQTTAADHMFSTDRPLVRKIAQGYTRAAADGAMHQFSVSATSGSLTSQYHSYLKRLLGSDDYQTFVNGIKWRKSDPLKVE